MAADQALKDLYATELFADVAIRNNAGAVVIEVRENPVVNRIILEGNKRLKDEKLAELIAAYEPGEEVPVEEAKVVPLDVSAKVGELDALALALEFLRHPNNHSLIE